MKMSDKNNDNKNMSPNTCNGNRNVPRSGNRTEQKRKGKVEDGEGENNGKEK